MEQNMFDILLALPLFQGLGKADLTRILESTHFDFATVGPGQIVCRQDTLCDRTVFVLDGSLEIHTLAADRRWGVAEHLLTNGIFGLKELYGRKRTFAATATALTRTKILNVDKRTMGALFRYFEVMQINVLNLLTSELHRHDALAWLPPVTTLEGRILHFCSQHVARPAGYKRFEISQQTLGLYLGEDPRYISRALHNLEHEDILRRRRRCLEFPAFERAIAYITSSNNH